MFSWFDDKMAKSVDALTLAHCEPTSSLGELQQLARLFGSGYLRKLHREMTGGMATATGPGTVLQIKLGWIDKIPLAQPAGETKKTELGDAVLFAIEDRRIGGGAAPIVQSASAVILQAKVTTAYRHMKRPTVPVASMRDSTRDEYRLLSGWPQFDLYKASASKDPLLSGIALNPTGVSPQPLGWYLAAPRVNRIKDDVRSVWPSWWMLGPPVQGHPCGVSFGGFLKAFLRGQQLPTDTGSLAAGAPFRCISYPPPKSGRPHWDGLCAEIIDLVENAEAPQYLFGAGVERMAALDDIHLGFLVAGEWEGWMWSDEPIPAPAPGWAADPILRLLWHADRAPVPPRRSGRRGRQRRIPVLIFRTTVVEGEG